MMEFGNGTTYTGQYRIGYDGGNAGYAIYDIANATNRLFIKANGNVGINNSNPGSALDFSPGGSAKLSHVDGLFGDTANNRLSLASFASAGGLNSSSIQFFTANGTTSGERMRIDPNGNVGIGTSNPTAKVSLLADTTAAGGIAFGADTNLYRSAANTLTTDSILTTGGGLVIGSGGTQIKKHLSATTTWDPPSVANAAATSTTFTVTGAAMGDTVDVGFSQSPADGMSISGWVSAANTVKVTITNLSGSAQDLASGTLRADIWQH